MRAACVVALPVAILVASPSLAQVNAWRVKPTDVDVLTSLVLTL